MFHVLQGGIQVTLFPFAAGRLPLNNPLHVVHPVDHMAIGVLPDLPPDIIIVKTHVKRPGLWPLITNQCPFGLVDGGFDFHILAAEIRRVTADQLVIQEPACFLSHPQYIEAAVPIYQAAIQRLDRHQIFLLVRSRTPQFHSIQHQLDLWLSQ